MILIELKEIRSLNILKKINFIRPKPFIQGPILNRNRTALSGLRALNYPESRIRKALADLNGIDLMKVGNGAVSTPTIYSTVKGKSDNNKARSILARSLGLKEEELFPEI